MPLPPPPEVDIIGWIVILIIAGMVIVGIVWTTRYILSGPHQASLTITQKATTLETVMRELLEEVRMLRREIEELRKEMKE